MGYKDREKKREHDRQWKAAKRSNPDWVEKVRAQARKAVQKHRMKYPDRAAQWEKTAGGRWKRASLSADGSVTGELLDTLLATPICPYCCESMDERSVTIDHIVPISQGGSHTADNLAAVCATCNRAKHAMSLIAYLYRLTGPPAAI